MPKKIANEQKAEALRLRIEERLSLKKIAKTVGMSLGTVSLLLREHRLTDEEMRTRGVSANRNNKHAAKQRPHESDFHRRIVLPTLSPQQKSKVAEAAVTMRLLARGFEVYSSVFNGQKFDMLVCAKDRLFKIQVKMAKNPDKAGLKFIRSQCSNGRCKYRRYTKDELDFLIGYDLFSDKAYVFSYEELGQCGRATLDEDAEEKWDKLI